MVYAVTMLAVYSFISGQPCFKLAFHHADLYAFNIGCYVIWATVAAIGYAVNYLKTHDAKILLLQIMKWTGIIWKSSLILTFWVKFSVWLSNFYMLCGCVIL